MPRPSIAVAMIVRNERRDLPRALASVKSIADYVVIVDTGSTDGTQEIARDLGALVFQYTAASIQDDKGNWLLQDFSRARNHALERAEERGATWVMWLDADDVLITPAAIKRASYWAEKECFAAWIESGNTKWIQHRMIRADKHARFHGRCHEYLRLEGLNIGQLDDALIVHHGDPHPGESSNARNLRILLAEWEDEQTPRTAFYIANTHRDGGRHKEAVEWYGKRIAMGEGFRDEWLFSLLYQIRSARTFDSEHAERLAHQGLQSARDWMEFRMELAQIQYSQKRYEEAIKTATPALDAPMTPTVLWRETWNYKDAPARLISWCHEHLGNPEQALSWAKLARDRIGNPDPDWDARIERLEKNRAPAVIGKARDVICVRRPGAIGDVLMTLNLLPALKEANPGREIWYFTDPRLAADDALGWLIRAAGADQVMSANTFEAWARNSEKAIDLVGYPLAEGYPDKPMRRHLLEYFAKEMIPDFLRFSGGPYGAPAQLPALTVRRPLRPLDTADWPYATIQMNAGWSKYKQWDEAKWKQLYKMLPLSGNGGFRMVDVSMGYTLQQSIALFANARMHIGIDSFCNHLTNYFWQDEQGGKRVPAVILWGSTQASAAGYPTNSNISLGLPCQPCFRENPSISRMPRGPCVNPPRASYDDDTPWACTRDISVEQVVEAVRAMWEQTNV